MARRKLDFERLDEGEPEVSPSEEEALPSSRPRPAPGRSASRLGPLAFEDMDALAEDLLSERPDERSEPILRATTPPPSPLARQFDDDHDDRSLSQILDVYDALGTELPPERLRERAERLGAVPRGSASEAQTEVATAEGLELQSPASLGPNASSSLLPRAATPVAPSRALDVAGVSRAQLEEAVAAAEARRVEIAPRVEVESGPALRFGVLLASAGALLLGFLVFYLVASAPLPGDDRAAEATPPPVKSSE